MSEPTRLRNMILRTPLYRRAFGNGVGASFARGAVAAFLLGLGGRFISFPTNVALTRALGAENFGEYTYITSWVGLPLLFAMLGLPSALVRYIPEYTAHEDWPSLRGVMRRATQIVVLTATIAAVGSLIVVWIFRDEMSDSLFMGFLIGFAVLPLSAIERIRASSLRAMRKIAWSLALTNVLEPLLLAALVLGMFLSTEGNIGSSEAMVLRALTIIGMVILGTFIVHRALPSALSSARPRYTTREWLRVSLPMLLISGANMVMNRADIIIIGLLLGPSSVAFYVIGMRMGRLTSVGLDATNQIFAPMIAELYARDQIQELKRVVSLSIWIAVISSVLAGSTLVFLQDILLGFFGLEFVAGSSVMMILIVGNIVSSMTGNAGALLAYTGRQDSNAVILLLTAGFNAAINYPAILLWGIEGAAAVTSISIASRSFMQWYVVRRRLGVNSSIFGPIPFRGE